MSGNKRDEFDLSNWVDERLTARIPGAEWNPSSSRGFARFQERQSTRPLTRRLGWLVIGVIGTSLSLAAFPSTRAFAHRCLSLCLTGSNKLQELLSGSVAPTNVFVRPSDRTKAPDFTLSDVSGHPVKLSDFRGKVVLLNFWATWCVPCNAEVPLLMEFQQKFEKHGFQTLGVSMDEDGWTSAKPFINEKHVNYPVMIGTNDIAGAYGGLEAIPTTLIIDRSGRIAARHLGLCRREEYEADIRTVLNE